MFRKLSFFCILLLISTTTITFAGSLTDISEPIEGQRMRKSSTGPEGSNRDRIRISPGQTRVLAELEGPGVIQHIWCTFSTGVFRYPEKAILRIYWDDSPEPSVQAPLGDFFAIGHGMRTDVNSEPVQVSAEGRSYNCFWQMPFRRKARIEIENQARGSLNCVYYYVDWLKLKKPKENAYYFHAQYRQSNPHEAKPFHTILETTGKGNYVGTVLSAHGGYNGWFGEGNDKFFIDDDATPRLTGTGTEDYFNDAWGFRPFCHSYAGCTVFEGRSIDSRITAYRWHIKDPVPFEKSLRFTVEKKGWIYDESGKLNQSFGVRRDKFASVAFWYQDKPAVNVPPMPPLSERLDPEIYLDSRRLKKVAKVEGKAEARVLFARPIKSRHIFQLKASQPDAQLTVAVKVKEKGRYAISLWKIETVDGGIYEVSLDDNVIVNCMDFYQKEKFTEGQDGKRIPLRNRVERKLGLFYLEPGIHHLRFRCVGRNPQSHLPDSLQPAFCLGLDGLSLRKIPFEKMDQYLPEK